MNRQRSEQLFVEVHSPQDVRALASEILSSSRNYPVIALTARPGESKPALSVLRIREIAGPETPIYFIPSPDVALRLSYFLPRCLAVNRGAARLWWPGVEKDSRPEDHPRFYDVRGDYQDAVYEWLEAEFCPSAEPQPMGAALPLVHARRRSRRAHEGDRANVRLVSGMRILSHFVGRRAMGHAELACRANVSRPFAHRCLLELTAMGYLTETRERRYRLAGSIQPRDAGQLPPLP